MGAQLAFQWDEQGAVFSANLGAVSQVADKPKLPYVSMPLVKDDQVVPIAVYSKSELAAMYGVHLSTLTRWLAPHVHKLQPHGYTTRSKKLRPRVVKEIFAILGEP